MASKEILKQDIETLKSALVCYMGNDYKENSNLSRPIKEALNDFEKLIDDLELNKIALDKACELSSNSYLNGIYCENKNDVREILLDQARKELEKESKDVYSGLYCDNMTDKQLVEILKNIKEHCKKTNVPCAVCDCKFNYNKCDCMLMDLVRCLDNDMPQFWDMREVKKLVNKIEKAIKIHKTCDDLRKQEYVITYSKKNKEDK